MTEPRPNPAAPDPRPNRTHRRTVAARTTVPTAHDSRHTPWLLASAVALFVARPFVPGMAIAQEGYGAIFVLLWLMLLAAWLVVHRERLWTVSRLDLLVLAFFALYALSGVAAAVRGSPRPAANVTWHWLSVGIAYFLFRQLLYGQLVQRATLAVIVALSASLAALGLEQALVSLPEARIAYKRFEHDPQQLYVQTGQWLPEGSAARQQFEARLESAGPTATFVLANSLAAWLVAGVTLLTGILATRFRRDGTVARAAFLGLVLTILVACLVLTESRSGIVAAVLAAFVAAVLHVRRPRLWLSGGAVLACLTGGAAYWLRPDAVAAAVNSLAYRLEYWQATWAMIWDFPFLGCGPGQFQDVYTAYKLPSASEEVADPHNFLLEVWSTGGTVAVVVLLALLVVVVRAAVHAATTPSGKRPSPLRPSDRILLGKIYLSAVVGVILGVAAARLDGVPLSGVHVMLSLLSLVAALAVLHGWVVGGAFPPVLPAIAAAGLLLHLCASGGIGEPALNSLLWLCVALLMADLPPAPLMQPLTWGPSRLAMLCAIVLVLGLLAAAYVTYYRPTLAAAGHLARADAAAIAGDSSPRVRAVEDAVNADPWSIEAARYLAALQFDLWQKSFLAEDRTAWQQAGAQVRQLAPRRHSVWRESAERYATLHRETGDLGALAEAIAMAERAIDLYATNADHHLFHAELLVSAGRDADARPAIEKAQAFDLAQRQAGHGDKTLPPDRRKTLDELARRLGVYEIDGNARELVP